LVGGLVGGLVRFLSVGGLLVWWVGCWDVWLKGTLLAEHSTFTAVSPLTFGGFC